MNFIKYNLHPLFITFTIIIIFIYLYPAGLEPGDAGVKFIQVIDFVNQDFKSLACNYKSKSWDVDFEFLPMAYSFFLHIVRGDCYYVFPYQFTLLLTPFYLLFGKIGAYLIPLISTLGIIWLFWIWSNDLLSNKSIRIRFIYYLSFATGLLIFTFMLSETNLNVLLVSLSFYYIYKSIKYDSDKFLIYSFLFCGIAIFFRQETLALPFLIAFCLFASGLFKPIKIFKHFIIFVILVSIFLISNYWLLGNILGLRANQQIVELNEGSFVFNRFKMMIELLFYGRFNVGILFASPILIIGIYGGLKYRIKTLFPIFLSILLFIIILPIATITYQGVGWGTRFLLSITPFLLMFTFVIYERYLNDIKFLRLFINFSTVWSIIGILISLFILDQSRKQTSRINFEVNNHSTNIILLIGDVSSGTSLAYQSGKDIYSVKDETKLLSLLKILKENSNQSFVISVLMPSEKLFNSRELFPNLENLLIDPIEIYEFNEGKILNISIDSIVIN